MLIGMTGGLSTRRGLLAAGGVLLAVAGLAGLAAAVTLPGWLLLLGAAALADEDEWAQGLGASGALTALAEAGIALPDIDYASLASAAVLLGVMAFILERQRTLQAARGEALRLRSITDAVPGAVFRFVAGRDGAATFSFMSRGVLDLLELAPTTPALGFTEIMA